jgi:hypothetical protein
MMQETQHKNNPPKATRLTISAKTQPRLQTSTDVE